MTKKVEVSDSIYERLVKLKHKKEALTGKTVTFNEILDQALKEEEWLTHVEECKQKDVS